MDRYDEKIIEKINLQIKQKINSESSNADHVRPVSYILKYSKLKNLSRKEIFATL